MRAESLSNADFVCSKHVGVRRCLGSPPRRSDQLVTSCCIPSERDPGTCCAVEHHAGPVAHFKQQYTMPSVHGCAEKQTTRGYALTALHSGFDRKTPTGYEPLPSSCGRVWSVGGTAAPQRGGRVSCMRPYKDSAGNLRFETGLGLKAVSTKLEICSTVPVTRTQRFRTAPVSTSIRSL